MLKKLSKPWPDVIYNAVIIITYVLLSRTLQLYFIEYVPVMKTLYAFLSRLCAVAVMAVFLMLFKKIPKRPFFALCGVYGLMLFSTLINGGDLWRLISITYPILALCGFVLIMCSTRESTKRFLKTMSMFFTVIMGINLFLAIVTPDLLGRTDSNGIKFFVGLENHIIYSQTIGLLFALFNYHVGGSKRLLLLYAGIYVVTTLVNFSAGSVIGVAVLVLYFAVPFVKTFFSKYHYGWQLGLFAVLLIALVFFAGPILNFPPIKFFIEEVLHKSTTLTHRTNIWPLVLNGIYQHPFLGHGLGDSGNLFQLTVYGQTKLWSAHNQYLQFVYEYGLITLGAVVVFLFVAVNSLKKCPNSAIPGEVKAFGFAIMVMYLVEAPSFNALFFVMMLGSAVCHSLSKAPAIEEVPLPCPEWLKWYSNARQWCLSCVKRQK